MKILELITGGEPGGAQRHVAELSGFLVYQGHQVIVAHGGGRWLANQLNKQIQVIYLEHLKRAPGIGTDIAAYRQVRDVLSQVKPDVVHCHSSKAGLIGRQAAWQAQVPSVYTAHGYVFVDPTRPWVQRKFYRYAEIWGVRHSQATIVLSQRDFREAQAMAPSVPIYHIPNGVVPAPILAGITRDIPRIGFMGRFSREKGLDWLIPLAERHPEWQWIFAGDGDLRELVFKSASRSSHIVWDGWVEEVGPWFQSIDVLVQPSWKEGMPYTIIDAMAHCVPVVATRVGAMSEIVEAVDNGLLVNPGDSSGLLSAIGYALNHHERLGVSSHHYVSRHLNRDIQLAKVAEVLQSVVGS